MDAGASSRRAKRPATSPPDQGDESCTDFARLQFATTNADFETINAATETTVGQQIREFVE
jgi:hypothetical protein